MINVEDAATDERVDNDTFDVLTGITSKSVLCAPLLHNNEVVGVIQAVNKHPSPLPVFDKEDEVRSDHQSTNRQHYDSGAA
jgi:hypothetical protein